MSSNPLLRYGAPKQINCTLGISGEFPVYTSGSAYTGTVSINGAQGATTVALVPPGLDDVGTEYVPLRNAGFEAAGDWVVDPARIPAVAPGFSIQSGTGRTGTGFLRWQGDPAGAQDKFNSLTVARTIASGRIDAAVWVRCTAHSGGGGNIQAGILIEQFADEALTIPLGSVVSSFAIYNGVDTNWRKVHSWTNNVAGYTRVSIIVTQGINTGLTATLEFDDVEWNARGVATGAPSTLGLPAGFTIDTVTSPDRVRVQWPGIPTPAPAAYSLLHFDGTNGSTSFPDESARSWTRLGSPVVSTTQSRFGGASGQFDLGWGLRGPFDLSWTQSNVNDDGNWTAEFWIYLPSNITTYQPVFAINNVSGSSGGSVVLRISGGGGGTNELYFSDNQSTGSPTGYVLPTLQWIHIAIVRNRQFTHLYADGALRSSESGTANSISSAAIWLGRMDTDFGPSSGFTGFIDEFRFSNAALYSGTTITVPTAAFTYSSGPATSTLPNLNFETGDVNYLKGAGWSITNAAPVDAGSWSAKYTGLGQSNIVHETMAPVTAGTSITASCRVSKGNNRQDFAGGAVLLQWFDANTRLLGFNVGNVINTGTAAFQTSIVTATAPAGAAFVRLGASGSRDVKGRATDVVAVDAFAWDHTFALGGSGGSGGGATPVTGPVSMTFRVTDANGCTAVATRTIGQGVAPSATSLLNLNGTNGSTTFTDAADGSRSWTSTSSAVISTAQSRYGGASLSLPNVNSRISASMPGTTLGTPWGIQFWAYLPAGWSSGDNIQSIFTWGTWNAASTVRGYFGKDGPTGARLTVEVADAASSTNAHVYTTDFPRDQWVHIAIAADNVSGEGRIRIYVAGTQVINSVITSGATQVPLVNASGGFRIGDTVGARGLLGAFIDDFQLVIGSPIYTANFTPPGQLTP